MPVRARKVSVRAPPLKPREGSGKKKEPSELDLRYKGKPSVVRVGREIVIEERPTVSVVHKKAEMAEKLIKAYPALGEFLKKHPEAIDRITEMLETKFREQIKAQEKREEVDRKINEAFFERIGWPPFDRPTELAMKAKDTRIKSPEAIYERWMQSLNRELLSFQASLEVQEEYIKRLKAEIKQKRFRHYWDLLHFGPFPIPRVVTWVREWKLWKRRELFRAKKNLENNKRLTETWNSIVNATMESLTRAHNKFKEKGFDVDPVKNAELYAQEFQKILRLHNENISYMKYLLLGKPYLKKQKTRVRGFGTIELSQEFYKALNKAKQLDRSHRVLVAAGEEHFRQRKHKPVGSPV